MAHALRAIENEGRNMRTRRHASAERCGIVLAAGEGKRVKDFVFGLRGDALPKQYVNFIGSLSLLQRAFGRAQRLIPPERLFTVISRAHLEYPEVMRQLVGRPSGTVITQPENKETGPGVLLPLIHLNKRFPGSSAAVFPSDHFVLKEDLLMAHVDLAFRTVEREPSSLVLLGVEPDEPEPEYGYILPGDYEPSSTVRTVRKFVEKPHPCAVPQLIAEGGLWSTMIMVFRVDMLVDFISRAAPRLHRCFEKIRKAIGTSVEDDVAAEVYRNIEGVNFSSHFLESFSRFHPARLLVVPVRGVYWSDWGSEARLIKGLRRVQSLERAGRILARKRDGLAKKERALHKINVA